MEVGFGSVGLRSQRRGVPVPRTSVGAPPSLASAPSTPGILRPPCVAVRPQMTLKRSRTRALTAKAIGPFWKCFRALLHLVAGGMIRPLDLGIGAFGRRSQWKHWTDPITQDPSFGHSPHEPVWAHHVYHVPQLRYHWGDSQYELHAGAKELFLDLVFVGIAYEVGVSLKASMYSCNPDPWGPSPVRAAC